MNTFMIVLLCVAYFIISRIIGNFVINVVWPSEDRRGDHGIIFLMWMPVIGEGALILGLIAVLIFEIFSTVNEKTNNAAAAVRKRFGAR